MVFVLGVNFTVRGICLSTGLHPLSATGVICGGDTEVVTEEGDGGCDMAVTAGTAATDAGTAATDAGTAATDAGTAAVVLSIACRRGLS